MIAPRRRIALYSPGMVGLGHMRRNLLIAQALASAGEPAAILLLAEAREAGAFAPPPGVDCLTLPALTKDGNGNCWARHLDLPVSEIVALRAKAIRAALEAFAPDILIVDHLPRGALGELDASLAATRAGGRTRRVLGLRDVLGAPEAVRREWERWSNVEAIRSHYDAIWVYGDPAVCDPVREYGFPPDLAACTRFTGYLDHCARLGLAGTGCCDPVAALGLPEGRLFLCLVGGGQDGGPLAEAFAQARLPPDASGIVLTGPFMPPAARQRVVARAAGNPRMRVLEFMSEPALLIRRADRVVAMGGYNTVCEVLSFGVPTLVVARVGAGREQWIRAERLRALGAIETLPPAEATPEAIARWLAADRAAWSVSGAPLDFGGLERLPRLLDDVLEGSAVLAAVPCVGSPCAS